nr:MAG TPA: hypothetical protein [Caudoviricetes sp.]
MNNSDEIEAIKKRIEYSLDGEMFMSLSQDVEDDIDYRPQIRKARKRKVEMFEWLRKR